MLVVGVVVLTDLNAEFVVESVLLAEFNFELSVEFIFTDDTVCCTVENEVLVIDPEEVVACTVVAGETAFIVVEDRIADADEDFGYIEEDVVCFADKIVGEVIFDAENVFVDVAACVVAVVEVGRVVVVAEKKPSANRLMKQDNLKNSH